MVFPTNAPGDVPLTFTPTILPPYLRRAKSFEVLLPRLYLKGISTGDFSKAPAALPGPDAPGLSASTVTRLKADWWDENERWSKRDLSARRYVYFWPPSRQHALHAPAGQWTASISHPGWTRIVNVCWSLSVPTNGATRMCWA